MVRLVFNGFMTHVVILLALDWLCLERFGVVMRCDAMLKRAIDKRSDLGISRATRAARFLHH